MMLFSEQTQQKINSSDKFAQIIIFNLTHILEMMDWDIVRPKLFFYKITPFDDVNNMVKIIEDYKIEDIEKMIE